MQDNRCVGNHAHTVKLRPKYADAKVGGKSRSLIRSYSTGLFDLGSVAIRRRYLGVQANRARQGQQWTAGTRSGGLNGRMWATTQIDRGGATRVGVGQKHIMRHALSEDERGRRCQSSPVRHGICDMRKSDA
jgi:hypothetical protein